MSYGRPPQSSLDEKELTDDPWLQPTAQPNPQPMYSTGQTGQQAPFNNQFSNNQSMGLQTGPGTDPFSGQNLQYLASLRTPEDIQFQKKVRNHLIFYRILPMSAALCAVNYWFNKVKNRPNTPGRYIFFGLTGVWLGLSTFSGHFRKMVEQSQLNTPFMQAVRNMNSSRQSEFAFTGVPNMGELNSFGGGGMSDGMEPRENLRYPHNANPSNPSSLYDDDIHRDEAKPTTTYEELRARNRGYIK